MTQSFSPISPGLHPPSDTQSRQVKRKLITDDWRVTRSRHGMDEGVSQWFDNLHIQNTSSPLASFTIPPALPQSVIQEEVIMEEQATTIRRRFIHVKRMARSPLRRGLGGLGANSEENVDTKLLEARVAGLVLPHPPNDCICLELSWYWPNHGNSYLEKLYSFSSAFGALSFGG